MQNESLEEARKIIITSINNSMINEIDKVELTINLHHFLKPEQYEILSLNDLQLLISTNRGELENVINLLYQFLELCSAA